MFPRKPTKTAFGKANRSDFYYFLISNLPIRCGSHKETGFDFLGAIIVISISAALVVLMRLLLAN